MSIRPLFLSSILVVAFFICAGCHTTGGFHIEDRSARGQGFGGQRIFLVDGHSFTNLAPFTSWVSSLPEGAKLYWDSGCAKYKFVPLEDSTMTMEEFKQFCAQHGVKFRWRYGFW